MRTAISSSLLVTGVALTHSGLIEKSWAIENVAMNVSWAQSAGLRPGELSSGLQVHRASPSLTILRQSKELHFEAPFLYLIFGSERAVLIDTGAIEDPSRCPLAATIMGLLEAHYGKIRARKIELLVIHSHAHGDHVAADGQFSGLNGVRVVPARQAFEAFGIKEGESRIGSIDLGDRKLAVLPLPGHEDHHIAVYDPKTAVLFSGDSLYPGRLYIRSWATYKESIQGLIDFLAGKPLQWILGSHIEMSDLPGLDFPPGSSQHVHEHCLQLERAQLELLNERLKVLGNEPRYEVQRDFIICPI